MFALKSLPRLRLFSSKLASPVRNNGSYIKIGNRHIDLNGKHLIRNLFADAFALSFACLFTANTMICVYQTSVIEKPNGDNCPGRNIIAGLGSGMIFGFIKGITYSSFNVFFWLNAWYEHHHSNMIDTRYGKMREHDIRFHFIPNANLIKDELQNYHYCSESRKLKNAILLENLGVLDKSNSALDGEPHDSNDIW
jgi:hypothetical protein